MRVGGLLQVRLCVQVDHSSAGRRSWFLSRSSSRPRASTTAFSNAGQDLEIRDVIVDLNPFPPGSFKQLCLRTLQLLFWLSWAGFLGIFLAMQVTERGNEGFIDLLEGQASSNTARYKFALFVKTFWMLPAVVHIVVVWGLSVLRQRNGYVARNVWQSLKAAPFYLHSFCFRKPPHAAHRVAHSSTSVDKIDALFYPSSNLRIDAKRAWVNFCLWVVVVAIKVAFELLVVIIPLVRLMREVRGLSQEMVLCETTLAPLLTLLFNSQCLPASFQAVCCIRTPLECIALCLVFVGLHPAKHLRPQKVWICSPPATAASQRCCCPLFSPTT